MRKHSLYLSVITICYYYCYYYYYNYNNYYNYNYSYLPLLPCAQELAAARFRNCRRLAPPPPGAPYASIRWPTSSMLAKAIRYGFGAQAEVAAFEMEWNNNESKWNDMHSIIFIIKRTIPDASIRTVHNE